MPGSLALFITDGRDDIREAWLDASSDVLSVLVVDRAGFPALQDFDAFLMLGMFAHERYGGGPKLGQSQILSTHLNPLNSPSWAVTMPPVPVFKAIHAFNAVSPIDKINTLGIDLEFLSINRKLPKLKALTVKQAYLENL